MSRTLRLSKHGNSTCVPITKEAEKLGWHPDTKVEVTVEDGHLIIKEAEDGP